VRTPDLISMSDASQQTYIESNDRAFRARIPRMTSRLDETLDNKHMERLVTQRDQLSLSNLVRLCDHSLKVDLRSKCTAVLFFLGMSITRMLTKNMAAHEPTEGEIVDEKRGREIADSISKIFEVANLRVPEGEDPPLEILGRAVEELPIDDLPEIVAAT
jgi:hypothetical protein